MSTVVLAVVLELEIVAGVPLIPVEPAPYPAADAPLLPVPSPPKPAADAPLDPELFREVFDEALAVFLGPY